MEVLQRTTSATFLLNPRKPIGSNGEKLKVVRNPLYQAKRLTQMLEMLKADPGCHSEQLQLIRGLLKLKAAKRKERPPTSSKVSNLLRNSTTHLSGSFTVATPIEEPTISREGSGDDLSAERSLSNLEQFEIFENHLSEFQTFEAEGKIIFQNLHKGKVVKHSTLYHLVRWLIIAAQEYYWSIFLLSYRNLSLTSFQLVKVLQELRLELNQESVAETDFDTSWRLDRFNWFVKDWLQTCSYHELFLSSEENQTLVQLVSPWFISDEDLVDTALEIWKNQIEKHLSTQKQDLNPEKVISRIESTTNLMTKSQGLFTFSNFDSSKIASHMQMIEFALFKKINVYTELTNTCWLKSTSEITSPNVLALIHRFNTVSSWVSTEIVMASNQASMIKKFVSIAQECRNINNWNSLMAIVAGLCSSSVSHTLKNGISKSVLDNLKDLETLMAAESNYKNYRAELKKKIETHSDVEPPLLPYLGVILRDLTFADEANSNFINDQEMVNFDKVRILGNILLDIKKLQKQAHQFEIEDPIVMNYLENLTIIDRETLFKFSKREIPAAN